MKNNITILLLAVIFGLTACAPYRSSTYPVNRTSYEDYAYRDYQNYSDGDYRQYSDYPDRGAAPDRSRRVEVPDSYHVGSRHAPERHSSRDNSWVRSQNPQAYTIQLSEGAKPAPVAGVLSRAPKRDRMATVKSYQNGRAHFRGLYGSYHSHSEAKRALNALPDDLRAGAQIKQWRSVQGN